MVTDKFPEPIPNQQNAPCDLLPGQLDMVASIIRQIYENLRSAYMGRPYKVDMKRYPMKLWRTVAQTCVSIKADPGEYLEFVFRKAKDPANFFPNVLAYSPWARNTWLMAHPASIPKIPEQIVNEINLKAEDELLMALKLTTELINNTTKQNDITSDASLRMLRAFCTHIPPYIRCLLGYPDPQIMETYAKQAKDYLIVRPTLRDAAKKYGLPVDQILMYTTK